MSRTNDLLKTLKQEMLIDMALLQQDRGHALLNVMKLIRDHAKPSNDDQGQRLSHIYDISEKAIRDWGHLKS